MTSLAGQLSEIVSAAFERAGLPAGLGTVRVSDRPDLAQFQCNGAMAAAKIAKKNPREIAQNIVSILEEGNESGFPPGFFASGILIPDGADFDSTTFQNRPPFPPRSILHSSKLGGENGDSCSAQRIFHSVFSRIEIAGPGFINLDVTDRYMEKNLSNIVQSKRAGIPVITEKETVILDYGGPNIAKPMHVGHLRSSIIGDSLRRLFLFAGYEAIGDVHTGDWGTHLGMLFSDYEREGKVEWLLSLDLENPDTLKTLFADLEERYPRASAACKSDEAMMEKAKEITKAMQDHTAPYIDMWKIMHTASLFGMRENFENLGVHFDEWKGEASVHHLIPQMVENLKAGGWAVESQGAWIVPVAQNDDKKEIPPLILLKSDGAVLYGTTDLATVLDRKNTHDPAKIIYVVDQRQSLHFEQVFRAARKGALVGAERPELIFAGFGTMNGTDGKPFKTREGGVMKLEDLIAMGIEKAQARLDEASLASDMEENERAEIARKVAIAAIKYADLSNNRISDYVFDLERMTSFEGKTGPYLLYQAVRIRSLLKKAQDQNLAVPEALHFIIEDGDRTLALLLMEFPDHFAQALRDLSPHILCDYAYRLAQSFSSFYASCHILSEDNEALKASRLALCALTGKQLELVLSLLGITVPERM